MPVSLLLWGCSNPAAIPGRDSRVLALGATVRDQGGAYLAWSNTELRLRFLAPSIAAWVEEVPRADKTPETDWLAVQIDEQPPRRVHLRAGLQRVVLAQELSKGPHTLRLTKRTEPEVGTLTVRRFELPPGGKMLSPPRRPARVIEFVGDSITAGYGNEGANERCQGRADQEDATRSYAAIAAERLDAEARVMAWSGKGVLRNFDPQEVDPMPALFERALPEDPSSPPTPELPPADALVLAIGTNDVFADLPDQAALSGAFRALIERFTRRAPRAPLFLLLSPLVAEDYPHPGARDFLRRTLRSLALEQEGRHTEIVEQWADPAEGSGCTFHPNITAHARLGRELAEVIRPHLPR